MRTTLGLSGSVGRFAGFAATVVALGATSAAAQHPPMRPPDLMYHFPRWSPDGRAIVAISMTPTGYELVIFPDTGGTPERIPLRALRPMAADWTPDGGFRVLDTPEAGAERIVLLDRVGRVRTVLPRDSIVAATRDSSAILFEVVGQGRSTIFLTDRRRHSTRQISQGTWAEQGTFSSDGRRVVYERRFEPDRFDKSDIVIVDLETGMSSVVAQGTDPSWSPDDSLILFKSMDSAGDLFVSVVNPATRAVQRLAKGVHPHWSPDGRRVVFMVDRADHSSDIYTTDLVRGTPTCISCRRP